MYHLEEQYIYKGAVYDSFEESKHLTVAARGRTHGLHLQVLADHKVNTHLTNPERGRGNC